MYPDLSKEGLQLKAHCVYQAIVWLIRSGFDIRVKGEGEGHVQGLE